MPNAKELLVHPEIIEEDFLNTDIKYVGILRLELGMGFAQILSMIKGNGKLAIPLSSPQRVQRKIFP